MRTSLRLAIVASLLLLVYSISFTFRSTTDTRLNSLQTRALVLHGDIDLSRYGRLNGFFIEHGGKTYSIYGIGISVVSAPFYLPLLKAGANEAAAQGSTVVSFAVAAVLLMYVLLSRIVDRPIAVGATIVFGFGTTLWPLGTTALWQHAPVLFFLTLGLFALFSEGRLAPATAGLAFAMTAFIRLPMMILLPIFGLYYLTRGKRQTAGFLLGALLPLIGLVVQDRWIWGSWFHPGYRSAPSTFGVAGFVHTLRWELIGWRRGILVYSPALAIAFFGFVAAFVERRRLIARRVLFAATSVAAIVVFYAFWGSNSGASQYGYRYLLDTVPFLIVSGAYALGKVRLLRWPGLMLAVLSVFIMAMGSSDGVRAWDPLPQRSGLAASPIGRAFTSFAHAPEQTLWRFALVIGLAAVMTFLHVRRRDTVFGSNMEKVLPIASTE